MVHIITAVCNNLGIGKKNLLPWKILEDLRRFKDMTQECVVIMGSQTFLSLPPKVRPLPQRTNVVITHDPQAFCEVHGLLRESDTRLIVATLTEVVDRHIPNFKSNGKQVYVIGGEAIYREFLPYAEVIHLTHVEKSYSGCDRFFPPLPSSMFQLSSAYNRNFSAGEQAYYRFLTFTKKPTPDVRSANEHSADVRSADEQYLDLVRDVLKNGCEREERTGFGTLSVFGRQMRFDISKYIPILTTKRVPWKGCVQELLWFLRGDSDARSLQQHGVRIWDGNSSRAFLDKTGLPHLEEGDCGANYSFQWRHFGASYVDCHTDYTGQGVDQIAYILDLLRNDPYSRRIFLSAWNPTDLRNTVLPPCHVSAQFYVEQDAYGVKHLSCHMYQRSCDLFLGEPWNILSYSILTYILAKKTGMVPKEMIISIGDVHIYKNHIEQVKQQLENAPRTQPIFRVSDAVVDKDWHEIDVDMDFEMIGYFPWPAIKAEMNV
jgi:dihydrofolate reductase / thymidylate synthase